MALKRIFTLFALAAALLTVMPCTAAPALTRLPAVFHGTDVFLRVAVNGGKPLWMKLEVGGSASSLSLDAAVALGLRPNQAANLQIGPVGFSDVALRTAPDAARAGPDGNPLAGVLGEDFLGDRPLWIDTRGKRVWISQPPADDDMPRLAGLQTAGYSSPAR